MPPALASAWWLGTVPIGTGELRMIHSRVAWMLRPVERSMTVSAPQRIAQTIFSTSSSMEEVTAELPILALILVAKFRPMIIGSDSGRWRLGGWSAGPDALAVGNACFRLLCLTLPPDILAVGDIDHLLGDDAGAGKLELR